jgi:hypothetical protein
MIISHLILLRMRNISHKHSRGITTQILLSISFSGTSYLLWENVEYYGRYRQATDDEVIRRTHIAPWVHKATGTHSDYVILVSGRFHPFTGHEGP